MEIIPPDILLNAYAQGVFPMAEDGEIHWFAPKMRGMIPLDENFHIPKSLAKVIRKNRFTIRRDTVFREVILACSEREKTWIDETILNSYVELHKIGFAHSIEVWDDDGLQGGLYGVKLGKAFFGESMFSRKTDTSKIALVKLVEWLREEGAELLDTQWLTDHLKIFGGVEIEQEEYLLKLEKCLS